MVLRVFVVFCFFSKFGVSSDSITMIMVMIFMTININKVDSRFFHLLFF